MKDTISYVIENRILQKLTLSKSIDKDILRTTGRLIEIKGKVYLALESFYSDGKAIQKNIPESDSIKVLEEMILYSYKQLNIITTGGNAEIKVSKKGKISVIDNIKRDDIKKVSMLHNREKAYILSDNKPIDFLIALGVQDKDGRIFDKKRAKFRQINRFLETISNIEKHILKNEELYILDLCCGKSYLSFAVYYYFTKVKGLKVTMDCVDLKKDVIEYCSAIAEKLNYKGLNFINQDIKIFKPRKTPDLTVSLHACDIATDIVLAKGIQSGSKVIMSTPCCHHEIMGQLKKRGHSLDLLLEHSILKQKLADSITDALRCNILKLNGYDVNAIELIDPEETPKNVLIRAVKSTKINDEMKEKIKSEYIELCDTFGIKPYLYDIFLEN